VIDLLIKYIEAMAAHAQALGFVLIFVFMTIESSFIPFPSEVVMIPAGFLAARGGLSTGMPVLDLVLAIVCGILGSLAGAYVNYFLFRWLGIPFLERWGKYFFLPPKNLARAQEVFRQYGPGVTFFCRLLPGIRQLISIPAGLARMPHRPFALYTSLGAGLWVTFLSLLGWFIGKSTATMSYAEIVHAGVATVKQNTVPIVGACVILLLGYIWLHKKVMNGKKPAPAADEAAAG
jgi:membrane protein DedA with SNARE-associated domain